MEIKPIETRYKNYRFRSRTEARWAIFFDKIGYRWDYEEQGYQLSSGHRYLPDFKIILPNDKVYYAEVKKIEFDDLGSNELLDLRLFAREIGVGLMILPGPPEMRGYNLILPNHPPNTFSLMLFQDYEPYIRIVDEYWLQCLVLDQKTGRMLLDVDNREAQKSFGKRYVEAIDAAKSARFEHGETPI